MRLRLRCRWVRTFARPAALAVILAAVFAVSSLCGGSAPVLAQDLPGVRILNVPGDYATIQAAVDAAASGDIVQVAGGVYCQTVLITTAGVRLRSTAPGAAVLNGACKPGPWGIRVVGTAAEPIGGVEISGFVVEGFEAGILLQYATRSLVALNEVRNNVSGSTPQLPGSQSAQGILLVSSTFNEIIRNVSRENGHLGLGLLNSSYNTVRANGLYDNQAEHAAEDGYCSLMLWGGLGSTNNQIVENELVGQKGTGIMIGSGPATANLVAQNRIHGHAYEGIWATATTFGNVITQNDARGNAWFDSYDLYDQSTIGNTWNNNLGTCAAGSNICR